MAKVAKILPGRLHFTQQKVTFLCEMAHDGSRHSVVVVPGVPHGGGYYHHGAWVTFEFTPTQQKHMAAEAQRILKDPAQIAQAEKAAAANKRSNKRTRMRKRLLKIRNLAKELMAEYDMDLDQLLDEVRGVMVETVQES